MTQLRIAPGSVAPSASPRRSRLALWAGLLLALVVLAASSAVSILHLRQHIREQIAGRDGEALDALAAMQYLDDKNSDESISGLEDPGEQLQLALKISRLRNVLGVRLFSPEGKFVNAVPAYITETTLPGADLRALEGLKPVSHFLPQARLEQQDLLAQANDSPVPLLEVNIPLHEEHSKRLCGVAQFLMNGSSIASQYAELDRHLELQGGLVFAIGGAILVAGLAWSFGRLNRANRLLAARTSNLLKANRELALAARTSAVGAVTSHLIHGLRNPLNGLQSFVQDRAGQQPKAAESDWQLAVATTKRMEDLLNRVVGVLQRQTAAADYEVSLEELMEMLAARAQLLAQNRGVRLECPAPPAGTLSNHEADLILLILENLVQNALEATPPGKTVRVSLLQQGGRLCIEVRDQGPGIPSELAERLFTPCVSAKQGGSGIGLAICRQLAKHLEAELELSESGAEGCTFRLSLPDSGSAVHAGLTEAATAK